jgi:hypothetical protein
VKKHLLIETIPVALLWVSPESEKSPNQPWFTGMGGEKNVICF